MNPVTLIILLAAILFVAIVLLGTGFFIYKKTGNLKLVLIMSIAALALSSILVVVSLVIFNMFLQ